MGLLLSGIEQVGGKEMKREEGEGEETKSSILVFCLQIALAANKIAKKNTFNQNFAAKLYCAFSARYCPPPKKNTSNLN